MPELPEVQTVVVTLQPKLQGRRITGVQLARQDIVQPEDADLVSLLTGRIVQSIQRRGKRIIMTLDDSNRFFFHLGMTGGLTVQHADEAVPPHTHLILSLQEPIPGLMKMPEQSSSALCCQGQALLP
ncbi:MAG TPA: DNA-formamidopyrimidine glycosylase family protein, partial [Tepidisphaeraceae bacterium]|nr:DNA-formamidopyrimidine glycosylase family protein [Tepidisphaeraceae bacterium]